MGRDHHVICGQRLSFISISLLFLIISSWTQLGFVTEGRKTFKQNGFHQTLRDDKAMVRAQIGSRPPKCERRCRSCGHCEAIQVPTNPQAQKGKINLSTVSIIAYDRGEDSSNYKPMSWKCKCGNLIFNP
ncbi:EPIDERMAL PATTERNING FACTOR-like protein 2 [Gastrolobium bilobum]|uniref:EPIDERMAL PATTERNING FACTOR-like protein 2 n=1 Tax=Gastrolobium bilobum TaxID=150636 RepID=UPI002AB2C34D|nr:EPIDERMAL PATTERNING FACTOR-like protein 2 [Gastrolobium bilobum]